METEWKWTHSKRIEKMGGIVKEQFPHLLETPLPFHLLHPFEKLKNGDFSGLEDQINTIFYLLYTRKYLNKPVQCIAELTEQISGLGEKREIVEFYFYQDPDESKYRPYMIDKNPNSPLSMQGQKEKTTAP